MGSSYVESGVATAAPLRADARRSVEQIRAAAADLFRQRGFGVPLAEIAEHAGVSKGTIYHRFGGRDGLVESLLDELVGECVGHAMEAARGAGTPLERLETYLRRIWTIQYNEPAANDVLIRTRPGSKPSTMLCDQVQSFVGRLLTDAQADGSVRDDVTVGDLDQLILERGHALRAGHHPERDAYERHIEITLRGLRA